MAHKPDAKKTEEKHIHKKGAAAKHECQVAGCKAEYRSKGYCDRHYTMWRRGEFGDIRYSICSKEACKKPQAKEGMCEAHWAEKRKPATPAAA